MRQLSNAAAARLAGRQRPMHATFCWCKVDLQCAYSRAAVTSERTAGSAD